MGSIKIVKGSDIEPNYMPTVVAADRVRSALKIMRNDRRGDRTGSVVWRLKDALDLLERGQIRSGGNNADPSDYEWED